MKPEQAESIRRAIAIVTAVNQYETDDPDARSAVELVRAYTEGDDSKVVDLLWGCVNLVTVLCVGTEEATGLTPFEQLQQAALFAERSES